MLYSNDSIHNRCHMVVNIKNEAQIIIDISGNTNNAFWEEKRKHAKYRTEKEMMKEKLTK